MATSLSSHNIAVTKSELSEHPPVQQSIMRLGAHIRDLQAISAHLVERLAPVLAPIPTQGAAGDKINTPSTCAISSEIDQACDLLLDLARKLESARQSLCI